MYSSDLGWCSFDKASCSTSDDAWIACRLIQIANGDFNPLVSRWTFRTKEASLFSYAYHLMIRVASYAVLLLPAIWTTTLGDRIADYVLDRGQCLYYRLKGKREFYEQQKQMTQLFLTLAVAESKLSTQEAVDKELRKPNRSRWVSFKTYFYKPIQANTITRDLLGRAVEKTKASLTEEDLKTLLIAVQFFPANRWVVPILQKEYALEAIRRCSGDITLPEGLKFEGPEINAFIGTKCTINLNKATFSNVPEEAKKALEMLAMQGVQI